MGFYDGLKATAAALLSSKGQGMELLSATAGTYDPATGSATETVSSSIVTGIAVNYPDREIDGTQVQRGDRIVLISAVGAVPKASDVIVINGERNKVMNCKNLAPAGLAVMYTLQVRAGG
jgi:hypothetical protein